MKFYDLSVLIIVIVITVTAIVGGISYKILGPSNPITVDAENALVAEGEALLTKETGITIPVTPVISATGATGPSK